MNGIYSWQCKCEECLARRERHGTAIGARRCRRARVCCPVCWEATPHGTQSGYDGWACLCDDCRTAAGWKGSYYGGNNPAAEHGTRETATRCKRENGEHCAVCLAGIVHGYSGGYRWGCRCEVCRAAGSARAARQRVTIKPNHGTALAVKRGCRCAVCLASIPHGTYSGYAGWGCRCDDCRPLGTAGATEWARANPERRKMILRRNQQARNAQKIAAALPEWPVDPAAILERDGMMCSVADELGEAIHPIAGSDWSLDHIIPLGAGGYHAPWNVQVACPFHNSRKRDRGDRDLQERKVSGWHSHYRVAVPLYYRPAVADPWPLLEPVASPF